MLRRKSVLFFVISSLLAACQGDTGPRGQLGPTGPAGQDGADGQDGAQGQAGQDGADGQDGVTAIALQFLGRYETHIFDQGAAEIVAYDSSSQRIFQVNASSGQLDILDLSDPMNPTLVGSIDVAAQIAANTSIDTVLGSANSVAARNGIIVTSIEAAHKDERGVAAFFQASDATFLAAYQVGFLPDCIAFSPDGTTAVVANEGEPLDDYSVDPIGSVTVIDISAGPAAAVVTHLDFTDFNHGGPRASELDSEVRIFGIKSNGQPSSVAEDLEPEFVTFSVDSATAFVSLQENNAIAIIDLATPEISSIFSLGFKDHYLIGNELDASDRDGRTNLRNWPILGMLQPDTIATYEFQGETLLVTANEGDIRDYPGYSEAARVRNLALDPTAFPDAASLQANRNLGRLSTTTANGDTDGDGDYDWIYSFGGRSFSIYTTDGKRLYDSGNQLELVTAYRLEENFNANSDDNAGDTRSDAKGPEPEALAIGHIQGAAFAFIGLERTSGIVVYNISNPHNPRFVQFVINRDFTEPPNLGDNDGDGIDEPNPAAGDISPESLLFIPASESPIGRDLLIAGHEVSGTSSVYAIDVIPE